MGSSTTTATTTTTPASSALLSPRPTNTDLMPMLHTTTPTETDWMDHGSPQEPNATPLSSPFSLSLSLLLCVCVCMYVCICLSYPFLSVCPQCVKSASCCPCLLHRPSAKTSPLLVLTAQCSKLTPVCLPQFSTSLLFSPVHPNQNARVSSLYISLSLSLSVFLFLFLPPE